MEKEKPDVYIYHKDPWFHLIFSDASNCEGGEGGVSRGERVLMSVMSFELGPTF